MEDMVGSSSDESISLHVLDLPQLYRKPSYNSLKHALDLLEISPQSFDLADEQEITKQPLVLPEGVPSYLTAIIASPLAWIEYEGQRDSLWSLAGARLSERSGRSGMKDITRSFIVDESERMSIMLHEPSLTEDKIGLKTWSTSYILAKRLQDFKPSVLSEDEVKIIELGAGTGLLGIAAALKWRKNVILTDLREIVPNLQKNIELNSAILSSYGVSAFSGVLDWEFPNNLELINEDGDDKLKADVILVADPIYSPEHPRLLVDAISKRLSRIHESCLILAYPVRQAYQKQIQDLVNRLESIGLKCIDESSERSRDDWADDVIHLISIWKWTGHTELTKQDR